MIKINGLTKNYGTFQALRNISFEVKSGEVVGLLGLNGAGKTTCLRILTGYLIPTDGNAMIDGLDILSNSFEVKTRLGYLPEYPPLYQELNVQDYLKFVARLRGIAENDFKDEFLRVTKIAKLEQARSSLIRHLSHGYRKRVGIAQALIGTPPVLIFDEPVSGLDPRQIIEIRKLIRNLAGKHTILISSHILTEVSRTCDRVLVLHNGSLAGEILDDDLTNRLEDKFLEMTGAPEREVGK